MMENATDLLAHMGVVAIGRNEGRRLITCLRSLLVSGADPQLVVYVDSGSSDGSSAAARAMGVQVVELDLRTPFTAARARNEGCDHLLSLRSDLRFVQFIDGDCEMHSGWITVGAKQLAARDDLAVVFGHCRERFPDRSRYNRLCDIEWNTPAGQTSACGGIAMMRVAMFRQVGGFNPGIIAAEDTELCVRLRQSGWKVLRLDSEMVLHDAAMTRFGQWWRRMVRGGHGFAENAALHGAAPTRHWVKETRSNWFWGLIVPTLAIAGSVPSRGLSLLLLGGYGLLWVKIRRSAVRGGLSPQDAGLVAQFGTLAKIPMAFGQVRYWINRWAGKRSQIIEYKKAVTEASFDKSAITPDRHP